MTPAVVHVSVPMPTIVPGETYEAGGDFERLPALHCPACGRQAVWALRNGGDYYLGETLFCVDCGANGHGWESEPQADAGPVCDALREAIRRAC